MESTPGLRPLYRQVYDYLIRQIAEGVWRPAAALPSEQALAAELGVSQGTVRKALDVMAAEQLIERRQGKGTFVAEHTQESALFRFFRIAAPGGKRTTPQCGQETVRLRPAKPQEQRHLHLSENQEIVEIKRTRLIEGVPAIFEIIIIPHALFPGIDQRGELPNTLYSLYQSDYGINIVAAEEELRADVARKEDVKRINVPLGAPLLHIDRIALALDGTRVEWRISRCDTRDFVYAVTIS
ncbi:MAG: GntR family transcriptional regulator [Sphingomonadales bacterium]|nr:GntR family transcriptional regulator [Sphingomonadales bacterium]